MLWGSVVLGMQSLLLPVKVVSDGPIYHLYFAVRWWKAGRLFLVAAPFGENAATYFPANGDVWFTWLMVTWGGDRLARVGQAPFLLLSAIAVFRIGRVLGASRNSAIVATCWFVTSMPFLIYSFEANVDTIFVAFYLIAVAFFLLDFRQPCGTAALVLGSLAAGLAMGTKPVGVVFVPPLLAFVLAVKGIRSRSIRKTLAVAGVVLLGLLPACGFWFGRNLLLTGNPLYPLHVELFGTTILPGWYGRDAMRYSIYYLPMSEWRALIDILLALADPRLAPFWIAALAGAWAIGGRRSLENDRVTWTLAALAVLNLALYWVWIPYRTQQRFTLQAWGWPRCRWPVCSIAAAGCGGRRRPAATAPADPANLAGGEPRGRDSLGLEPAHPQRGGRPSSPVFHPGIHPAPSAGSRDDFRHPAIPRHGLLRGTRGLDGQPITSRHGPRMEEPCPDRGRELGTCRPGRRVLRGDRAGCQATFLSAFSRLLPWLARPGEPLGAVGAAWPTPARTFPTTCSAPACGTRSAT